ncbi:MAG: 50S ribosomal protein L15 [Flavobacteriaceae bacterium]|nr:50S ribosomal protein L15 [Flavobacteriaceae bacterium]MCY4268241.1 50S ribosomal protein L15 [Flavobacteriaceae bacterium]MCY4300044.1 50S ribosomal protein L15 [Flavobacteriaceae bacterium]
MSLEMLTPKKGSVHKKGKRLGRGQGSGKGGTATRGHKGQQSRSGYSKKLGFEGGQMPLQRRVPKGGFKNINRKEYQPVNLDTIQQLIEHKKIGKVLELDKIRSLGLAGKNDLIKILGNGEIKSAVKITAHKFSKKAQEEIEKAGGEAITVT